jgi:ATP-dependent DNA ligase
MRPTTGGPLTQETIDLLPGEWAWEPKQNGWRALIHIPTLTVYNRHGELMSIAHEFQEALKQIERLRTLLPYQWLDCEMLGRRHPMKKGHIVVFDSIGECDDLYSYEVRHESLRWVFDRLGDSYDRIELIESDRIGIATHPLKTWEILQEENHRYGCDYYEGLVAKRVDSPYEMQLVSPNKKTTSWVKFRFDQHR